MGIPMKRIVFFCLLLCISFTFASGGAITQAAALEKAYYAHVDLIRRGLPQVVVQAEYTAAINKIASKDAVFRTREDLAQFSVWDHVWNQVFDPNDHARYAMKYLQFITNWKPKVSFQTFVRIPELPRMNGRERGVTSLAWTTAFNNMKNPVRGNYNVKDLPFPENIQVLYDPYRADACTEYKKFGPVTGSTAESSIMVFKSLLVSLIRFYKMGGSRKDAEQLLRHYVAFLFDGVRCIRREKHTLKVPLNLRMIYAERIAAMYANISHTTNIPVLRPGPIGRTYQEELISLTSYNSWGNVEYAKLTTTTSTPEIINSLNNFFPNESISSAGRLLARQISARDQAPNVTTLVSSKASQVQANDTQPDDTALKWSDREVKCHRGYFKVFRAIFVLHPYELCCSVMCDIWKTAARYTIDSPMESCCARCNQYRCLPRSQERSPSYYQASDIFVPAFGEQESYRVCLIMI